MSRESNAEVLAGARERRAASEQIIAASLRLIETSRALMHRGIERQVSSKLLIIRCCGRHAFDDNAIGGLSLGRRTGREDRSEMDW